MQKVFLFGTFSLFFAQIVSLLSGYGVIVFLTRALGSSDYGVYAIVISLVSLLFMLIVGVEAATSKFISHLPEKAAAVKASALKLSGVIGLVAFIAYFFSADLIAFLLQDTSLVPFLRLSTLIIPAYFVYAVFLGYFNGLKQYWKQSLLTIFYSVSKFAAVILLVFAGFSVFGAIFGAVVASFAVLLFGAYFVGFKGAKGSFFDPKKILYFSIPITVFVFSFESALTIALLLVKSILMQNALAGYYNIALQISRLPFYFVASLSSVLFPFVSHSFSNNNPVELKQHVKKALKYFLIFVLPPALLISVFSEQIVFLFFGEKFLSSTQPLAILGIASIFISVMYLFCVILMAIEKQKQAMIISILVLAIAWVSNAILIPIFSLEGAAIATLIAFFIGSIVSSIAVWRFIYYYSK